MAYNFLGNALEAGRITPPAQQPQGMFSFAPQQPKEDKNISSEEATQLFSGKPAEQRKQIYDKLKSNGYTFEEEVAQVQPAQEAQGFLGGAASKTGEAFIGGLKRIGEAGTGLAEGKYSIPEAAVRGAAGSLQSFFSPLSGVVGQSVESFVPENVKAGVASTVAPIAQSGREFYAGQSPEQQRNLANLGVGAEVLANFLGGAGASKVASSGIAKKGVIGAGQGIKNIGKSIKNIKSPFTPSATALEDSIIKGVGAKTVDAVIDGVAVKIPKPESGMIKKAVGAVTRADNPKVLAGRALTPSYAGKTPKQIVQSLGDAEKNVKEYWKQVRTGKLSGDLTDLTTSAQSVIDNLDTVGARIGSAVKSAKGDVGVFTPETNVIIGDALRSVTAKRSPATPILQNLIDDLQGGIDVKDGFALKRVYQNEIGKLIKSGDAGTDQFSALVQGVDALTSQIDDLVEKSVGSKAFLQDKKNYALLKKIAGDIAKSAQVEARRSPMTLTEQIGQVRGILGAITSPIDTATNFLAKEIGEMNTRGGAWKALMDMYDNEAIKAVKKSDAFKDIKFLNQVKNSGEKMGISKEAVNILKSAKSAKDALEKANKAGVAEEIKKAYTK